MNGFHVQALGWVLVANARAVSSAEADELTDLWTRLVQIRAEDLREAYPMLRWFFPHSLPLSPATVTALAALVTRMTAQHPERFGVEALRERRSHWVRQAALGVLLCGLSVLLVRPGWAWATPLAPTFFLMACSCLLPVVTLWRAAIAVRECRVANRSGWHLPESPSKHLRTP